MEDILYQLEEFYEVEEDSGGTLGLGENVCKNEQEYNHIQGE